MSDDIKKASSAQPEQRSFSCDQENDLISRQAAWEVLTKYYHHTLEIQHVALVEALSMVPSAQPEKRTEERAGMHACDCISRHAGGKEFRFQHKQKWYVMRIEEMEEGDE